jgi:hypothetical protein
MPEAFVIEISGRTMGIVASRGRGFRFQAANASLSKLDGQTFKTIEALRLRVETVIAKKTDDREGQHLVHLRGLY